MFIHQGTNVLNSSTDDFTNVATLKTIPNVQIPVCSIVTIPTERTGKCDTTNKCIFKVDTDEIGSFQNPQLVIFPTIHLNDYTEPEQVPLMFKIFFT